ncbi:Calx-beta domain-containing protein [Microcystis aeruginosa]|uniref:Alkaline phosphatase n=1 Tax=Microcystis aeruginosa NIES-44 TaxID=449439 RepID=A0A0A1VZ56_MICAE|nr:Calx-beta domain-containing protein [Microcystis aeruginosa]GAL94788.1 alkaline phosphatase [Microcystis aeruginosa NIES-44]
MTSSLLPILPAVDDVLFNFAQSDGFWANLAIAFGTSYDVVKATELRQQWQSRNFSQIPPIEVLSGEVLGTANGAYSSSKNKIYLSASFLNTASSAAIVNVILEEIGHYVDAQVNQVDSAGDEGAIFAELVQGNSLDVATLEALRAENDQTTIIVNGEIIQVEQADFTGTNGNDNITGTSGDDNISGLGGNDTLSGLAGNDRLEGGSGNNTLYGGTGNDVFNFAYPLNTNTSDVAMDFVQGQDKIDVSSLNLSDWATLQLLISNDGQNNALITTFFDGYQSRLKLNGINPTLLQASDFIFNTINLNQTVNGSDSSSSANDQLFGGLGNDTLRGFRANDTLFGEQGDDRLEGGSGNDTLYGGLGDDTAVYSGNRSQYSWISNQGVFTITDSVANRDGIDNLYGIQKLQFSDQIVTIAPEEDFPSITLAVSPSSVTEDGTQNLIYTFTRTGSTTNPLTVNYSIGGTATNGTDYASIPTGVIFAANSATATVIVDPTADTTVESDETVILTLAAGTGYTVGTTTAVTGTITNDDFPSITLAVSPSSVTEDGTTNLVYTFTRTGSTTNPLTVNYTIGGTATLNTDYTRTGTNNTVTFAANSATATVTVDPTADTTVESDETVILTLAAGTGYTVGTTTAVTGTITNDDFPSITLAVSPSSVTEDGTANLVYTFTRTGVTTNPLTVNYTLGGTATLNTDYTRTGTTNTVNFAAGSSTATVTVDPTADTTVESDETVILTLAAGTGYTVGTTTAVTGTITNDDTTVTSQLSINNITVVEGLDNNAILTVTVNTPNPQPISFNYTTAPIDATANVDYTSKTGTITIAPNTSTATISIPILNDNLNEADEAFTVTLSNPLNATINPEGGIGEVIITDTWQTSLTRTLPNNVENLRLIGSNNINGTGNAGNNNITGNSGINQINGGAGIDTLTGGLGADTFVFQFGQSTISTSDRITDFAINTDKIDLLTQGGSAMSAPSSFSRAADSTATTLDNLVNQVFTDANGATTGNQGLGINSAALVQVTTGAIAGTYLIINDSTAGFQSSNDLLINITGFTGSLPALGSLTVGNFFV